VAGGGTNYRGRLAGTCGQRFGVCDRRTTAKAHRWRISGVRDRSRNSKKRIVQGGEGLWGIQGSGLGREKGRP